MARTRKSIQPLNLYKYDVLVEDKGTRSEYFKISQFDGYLYGGRNSFLVAGASVLRPGSKVLVEILNNDGYSVYSAPVATFVEGNSRLIKIEVYEDTPIGPGKLVILGCADYYIDGRPVPSQWKNKYNVRWITDVIISPLKENKTPLRFITDPSMVVEEKFYYTPSSSAYNVAIQQPLDVQLSTKYLNIFPNGYLAKVTGPTTSDRYYSKYLNGILTGSLQFYGPQGAESASVSLPLTKIYNSTLAESEGALIYTDKGTLITSAFISASGQYSTMVGPYGSLGVTSSLNVQYNELISDSTGSIISFAKIRLVDLGTISGEIHKVRFSYKSATEPGEYLLLGEVTTSVAELLAVDSGSTIAKTGRFKDVVIGDYWCSATMSLQKNETNPTLPFYYYTSSYATASTVLQQCCTDLLDSISATPQIVGNQFINNVSYFIGTNKQNTVTLFPRSEYTLYFDAFAAIQSSSITLSQADVSLEIYLVPESGSTNTQLLSTDNRGQLIGAVTPEANFLKQNFGTVQLNFIPKINQSGNFGLRFVFYGGFWNIANISLKTAEEPFFSSDELDALLPNISYREKILTFKTEYLDVSNNSLATNTFSTPTYFTGSDVGLSATSVTSSYSLITEAIRVFDGPELIAETEYTGSISGSNAYFGNVLGGKLRVTDASSGIAGTTTIGGTTATTVGSAGGASALPATPLGYIIAHVGTTQVKIPYYNA